MKNNKLSIVRSGKGEPIILLHGWGMNAAVFEPLCLELAKKREIFCVNLPGYGGSDWVDAMAFQDQVGLLIEQLPQADLLGWSMGGLYAMEMARQNRQQIKRLYLVCCNPCFVRRNDWPCGVEEQVFSQFHDQLNQDWLSTIKRFLSLQMMGESNARQLLRDVFLRIRLGGEADPRALQFGLELLQQRDSRSLLAELDLPVKIILGKRDKLVPHAMAAEIVKLNENIQVESLATAAHAPFLSQMAQFIAML